MSNSTRSKARQAVTPRSVVRHQAGAAAPSSSSSSVVGAYVGDGSIFPDREGFAECCEKAGDVARALWRAQMAPVPTVADFGKALRAHRLPIARLTEVPGWAYIVQQVARHKADGIWVTRTMWPTEIGVDVAHDLVKLDATLPFLVASAKSDAAYVLANQEEDVKVAGGLPDSHRAIFGAMCDAKDELMVAARAKFEQANAAYEVAKKEFEATSRVADEFMLPWAPWISASKVDPSAFVDPAQQVAVLAECRTIEPKELKAQIYAAKIGQLGRQLKANAALVALPPLESLPEQYRALVPRGRPDYSAQQAQADSLARTKLGM